MRPPVATSVLIFFTPALIKLDSFLVLLLLIADAILEKNLDELYVMWQRRPPHVQISVSW